MSSSRFASILLTVSFLLAGLTGVSGCTNSCPDGWEPGKLVKNSCCPPDDGTGESQACLPPEEAFEAEEASAE